MFTAMANVLRGAVEWRTRLTWKGEVLFGKAVKSECCSGRHSSTGKRDERANLLTGSGEIGNEVSQ